MDSVEKQKVAQKSWWGRRGVLSKILIIAIPLLVVIGLAVGLGVGLTVGRDNDNGDDSSDDSGSSDSSDSQDSSTTAPASLSNNTKLWQPAVNSTWQIVLQNPLELPSDATSTTPNVSIFDIDLFTNDQEVIDTLHRLGKKVICYFSAGSYEPGRPDSGDFKASDKGGELDGWPGEYWLKLNSSNVRSIMTKRIALAAEKKCDAIDPDNVDGYSNKENNLGLTQQDSIDFMKFIATEAAKVGLPTGLKNAGEIIPKVLDFVHFSVNEQCHEYQECDTFTPFIDAHKPVFNIEYPKGAPNKISAKAREDDCATSGDYGDGAEGFSTLLADMDLNGFAEYCNGQKFNTPVNKTG